MGGWTAFFNFHGVKSCTFSTRLRGTSESTFDERMLCSSYAYLRSASRVGTVTHLGNVDAVVDWNNALTSGLFVRLRKNAIGTKRASMARILLFASQLGSLAIFFRQGGRVFTVRLGKSCNGHIDSSNRSSVRSSTSTWVSPSPWFCTLGIKLPPHG